LLSGRRERICKKADTKRPTHKKHAAWQEFLPGCVLSESNDAQSS
jgi:hypothetical protein